MANQPDIGSRAEVQSYIVCCRCGETVPKTGPNQKSCPPCRPLIARERAVLWGRDNKDRAKQRGKAWREANREKIALAKKQYATANAEHLSVYKREWARANPDKRAASKRRTYLREMSTPRGRIERQFRSSLARRVRFKSAGSEETMATLGYSFEELMTHLEKQFSKGMSWHNYGYGDGKWHIDHIRPLASFEYDTTDCEEFRAAWALTNLRPLWQSDNLKKGSRVENLL